MLNKPFVAALVALLWVTGAPVHASSLEMMPVLVNVPAPGSASTITLKNTGADSINAQVRVFKWTQHDGKDQLTPTRDVVASPPAVKIQAGKQTVVRVVRMSKAPVAGEETYRLVVDEVPKPPKSGKVGVGISLRYSVPVFFAQAGAAPDLQWKASIAGGSLLITGANAGSAHLRLADLQVSAGGKTYTVAQGLAGYVLSGGKRAWKLKNGAKFAGSTITIIAKGDNGPVNTSVQVGAGQ